MIILGIDPGFAIVGYSIIDVDQKQKITPIDYGVITTKAGLSIATRIKIVADNIELIIKKFKPDCMAIEELFFTTNQKTAINVSQTRGAIILTATNLMGADNLYEYTPLQIKQAITGYGKADKQQMQHMVKTLLKLDKIPKPDDAADALACAICHAQTNRFQNLFKVNK